MGINVNFGVNKIDTNSDNWESFLESFNKYNERIEAARAQLATQPAKQIDTLIAENKRLADELESEDHRIRSIILADSGIEFESTEVDVTEFIPTVELIDAKTAELMEELETMKKECREKKAQHEAANEKLKELKEQCTKVKNEFQEYAVKMLSKE